jgi:hypothetical protein
VWELDKVLQEYLNLYNIRNTDVRNPKIIKISLIS